MTIYDLFHAISARRRFVLISGAVVLLVALLATFTIRDGSFTWRSGQKWQATAQINVVSAGNDSLANAETRQERFSAAVTYSRILRTVEAVAWVGAENGFEPVELIVATVETGSSLISASVIAPSASQAESAALSIFDYLVMKLREPMTLAELGPPLEPTEVFLGGLFPSQLTVRLDAGLSSVPDDLFITVSPDSGSGLNLLVAGLAGSEVTVDTTLAPVLSVLVTLQNAGGQQFDQVRIAPVSVVGFVRNYPALTIDVGGNGIRSVPPQEEGESPGWVLNSGAITTSWAPGAPVTPADAAGLVAIDVGLVSTNPGAEPIGGRAGPIILGAVILLGWVLIITVVIVMDSWARHAPPRGDTTLDPASPWAHDAEPEQADPGDPDELIGPFSRLGLWEAKGVDSDQG